MGIEEGRRILIVDDNPDIHQDFRKILAPRTSGQGLDDLEQSIFGGKDAVSDDEGGYEVDSAFQGMEALEKVRKALAQGHPYALAFVDMRMPPGWDGLETIERIWQVDQEIQVVICTAYSDHSREKIVARTGRAHRLVILKKPFDIAEVAQLAYAMTAKWSASRQARMRMGELEALVAKRTAQISEANRTLQDQLAQLEQARLALEASEQRYALAAAGSNDGLWDWDLATNRVHYSKRWLEILGLENTEEPGTPDLWLDRVHPNDLDTVRKAIGDHLGGMTPHLEIEHRLRTGSGRHLWVLCRGLAVRDADNRPTRLAGSLSDISRRKETEDELRRGAYYDKLTGLPNRSLLRECVEKALLERRDDPGRRFAMLFLDFDNFKVINDSLGHLAGDELLVAIGARLSKRLLSSLNRGATHILARLGGDEFVILLTGLNDIDDAVRVAEEIHADFTEPIRLHDREVCTSASIGVAFDDGHYASPDEVLRDADTAMYCAKARGAGQIATFDRTMRESAMARLELENDLRWALQRGGIDVAYQPIIELETGRVTGVEALARWIRHGQGPVSPDRFIPLAEETGLIVPLGEHVLCEACRCVKRIREIGGEFGAFRVNVNLSSRQFSQPSLVASVEEILRQHNLSPEGLSLEVTETTVMEDFDSAAATIRRLRDLGVEVFMDDFGTGYSSLSCLKMLPLTGLKLDRSFVSHLEEGTATAAIIHAIVTLARHLQLCVVAEGIETKDQLAGVLALECDRAQGYLFGRPMPFDRLMEWLKNHEHPRIAA